jgi:hypothetical protein
MRHEASRVAELSVLSSKKVREEEDDVFHIVSEYACFSFFMFYFSLVACVSELVSACQ